MDFRQVAAIAGFVVMVPMGVRAGTAEPPASIAVRTYNYFGVPAHGVRSAAELVLHHLDAPVVHGQRGHGEQHEQHDDRPG